jgi:hypothetical protein
VPLAILPNYRGTREYLPECCGGTIAVRWPIDLSTEGFNISRLIRIKVMFDVIPLKGVPTGVTRVADNVRLSTTCSSCMYASLAMDLCVERQISIALRRWNTSLP